MSFPREARLYAIMRMHDNGFSVSDIMEFTGLSRSKLSEILGKVGRNKKQMQYYPMLNELKLSVDDPEWSNKLIEKITEAKQPGYLMSIENKIEEKYQQRFNEMYTKYVTEELGEILDEDDDAAYADKLINAMSKIKGVSKKQIIIKALVDYGRKLGLKKQDNAWGGGEITRANAVLQREVDQHYVDLEEYQNTDADEAVARVVAEYDKKKPSATREHDSFLPDYLK